MRDAILLAIMAVCFVGVGWFGNSLYESYTQMNSGKTFNGLWIPATNLNQNEALRTAYNYSVGNWVCVNIQGMTVQDMVTTCEHEVGHELFAEKCQTNVTKCLNEVGA